MHLPRSFTNPDKLLVDLTTSNEEYWIKKGEQRALKLFHEMSRRVPAYRHFLKTQNINPENIKSPRDFIHVPAVDKSNYLRKYPLEQLVWDGDFCSKKWTISATSGSTGKPFYFPREKDQDWQYASIAELYLRASFDIANKSTLYIIGFPMGPWIGGVFTFEAIRLLAERGNYNISVITAGINKLDIINAVRELGPHYDQIILGSYGPFMKDTIDDGERMGVDWKKYNMKLILSAEVFSESFRDYIVEKTGVENLYLHTLNHYGTVDLGTMSYETPISILARRFAIKNKNIYRKLFGDINKLPTLTQYHPELFYFEEVDGNLFCSAYSGIPLFRYDLKDHGGVKKFSEVDALFRDEGVDLKKEASKIGLGLTLWSIPFVWVYERSDLSVSFYAFNIYPETIRKAVQHESVSKFITGKFTMMVKYNRDHNQYLEINIELKVGVPEKKVLKEKVRNLIVKYLLRENSEYRKTYQELPKKATPKIVFWGYEHPLHFKPGGKQKWVKV